MATSLALTELTTRLQQLSREELLELAPEDLAQIEYTLKDGKCSERVASFDAGPLYWLTNLTRTENPQHEAQGLPFKAPFPKKSYLAVLFNEFLARYSRLLVPKSRTMLTSWSAVGYAAWAAQWHGEETV